MNVYYGIVANTTIWINCEYLAIDFGFDLIFFNISSCQKSCLKFAKLPDIVLYNSADDYNKGFMQSKAMVKPGGFVFWPLPVKLRSSCKIDVTYFPFDDQICQIKFGSWTYSGLQVDLVNSSDQGAFPRQMKHLNF